MNATVMISLVFTLIGVVVMMAYGYSIYEFLFSMCIFYFIWWILVSYADNLGLADQAIT